jgi:hypothetical protein
MTVASRYSILKYKNPREERLAGLFRYQSAMLYMLDQVRES